MYKICYKSFFLSKILIDLKINCNYIHFFLTLLISISLGHEHNLEKMQIQQFSVFEPV